MRKRFKKDFDTIKWISEHVDMKKYDFCGCGNPKLAESDFCRDCI